MSEYSNGYADAMDKAKHILQEAICNQMPDIDCSDIENDFNDMCDIAKAEMNCHNYDGE